MNTRHTWKKKDFWLAGTLDATFGVFFLKHRWCKQSFSVCTLFFHTSAPGAFCGSCPGSRTHTMWDFRRRAILALTVQMNHWGFPGPALVFWEEGEDVRFSMWTSIFTMRSFQSSFCMKIGLTFPTGSFAFIPAKACFRWYLWPRFALYKGFQPTTQKKPCKY